MQKHTIASALIAAALAAMVSCARSAPPPQQQMFGSPEEAVRALAEVVQAADVEQLTVIFGPDSKELVDTSDPMTARRNRETFTAAFTEGWNLVDTEKGGKTLVIGNEDWPFPVPLVKDGNRWRFDTAAGKAEVLARRIGRNELAVIRICAHLRGGAAPLRGARPRWKARAALRAKLPQRPWKRERTVLAGGEGQAAQPARRPGGAGVRTKAGRRRRQAADAVPRLSLQDPHGAGTGRDRRREVYVANGEMSGGFAMVAWPDEYDLTGIMTFIVNQDGIIHEKDLGADSAATASKMSDYNPDESWKRVE